MFNLNYWKVFSVVRTIKRCSVIFLHIMVCNYVKRLYNDSFLLQCLLKSVILRNPRFVAYILNTKLLSSRNIFVQIEKRSTTCVGLSAVL